MQVTVTFDLTKGKAAAMKEFSAFVDKWNDEETEAAPKKRGKRTKPETTVSDEEEESFGTDAVEEEELEEEEAEEESEDEESEEDGLSFDDVKAAINKYGEKKPDDMKAILLSFNMKSTKELEKHKAKWEPVYRKTMVKLKALKKAK